MIVVSNPADFFYGRVRDAMVNLGFIAPLSARGYLVNLLTKYAVEPPPTEPVVFDLLAATSSSNTGEIIKHYLAVGDKSLMITGVWPDSAARSLKNTDYYVNMGQMGYKSVSSCMKHRLNDEHFAAVYDDLSRNFQKYAYILTVATKR